MSTSQVVGVREAMKVLAGMDKALKREAVAEIKTAAEPLRAKIQGSIPSQAPLSGWDHKGRTGWGKRGGTAVKTQYGGRARRDKDVWPLVRIVLTGAAASMYDMAGRKGSASSASGAAFIKYLNMGNGPASRAAWPAAERMKGEVTASVLRAIDKVAQDANVQLGRRF